MDDPDMTEWDKDPATTAPVIVSRPLSFNKAAVKPVEHMAESELDATVHQAHKAYQLRVNTPLLWEAAKNNAPHEEMAPLLKGYIDLDYKDAEGNGFLHLAVGRNNLWLLARLIKAGADMHATNIHGVTPLMQCASGYGMETAGIMLALADPDPSVHVIEGVSALHMAALTFDKTRLVEALLQRGVPADIEDGDGKTPLYYAVAAKHDCAEVLCMAGGFREKDREKLQEAIAVEEKYAKPWDWNLLFDFAAKIPQEQLKANFPQRGPKMPPLLDEPTNTIFNIARNSNSGGFAMEKYIDDPLVHARDFQGRTPLMAGCDVKSHSLWDVRVLAYHSDPAAVCDSGRTILHYAAPHGTPAGTILDYQMGGTDIDAQDVFGVTALMVTTVEGCNNLARLMESDANPFIKNLLGMTAMDMAKVRKCDYAQEHLQEEITKRGWQEDESYGASSYRTFSKQRYSM